MTRRLPRTDSIKKLAQFWDTHDLTDFEDRLEEVTEQVFEAPIVVPLKLESDEAQTVRKIAKKKGIPAAELIHDWVREKIEAS